MQLTWLYFLAACLCVLGVSLAAPKGERFYAIPTASMLFASWGWSNWLDLHHIDFTPYNWLSDAVQGCIVGEMVIIRFLSGAGRPPLWMLGILAALMAKEAATAFYNLPSYAGTRRNYIICVNAFFAVELICASWPGGRGLVELLVGPGWLSHRRWDRWSVSPVRRQRADKEA